MGDIRLADIPPPGRLVRVGDSCWHILESGGGPSTVILEAGIAATSVSWAHVQAEVAKFARVISYDRAGLGWSDLQAAPRTPRNVARELREVLRAARIDPPFVLAAHSFGGLCAARYAMEYTEEVSGLVLVDALSPEEFHPRSGFNVPRLRRGIRLSRRGATLARWGVVRFCLERVLNGNRTLPKLAARISSGTGGESLTSRLAGEIRKLPPETWPVIAWLWSRPKSFEAMARYLESLPESSLEMENAELPSVPTNVILAANNQYGVGMRTPPEAKIITAEKSGHWVQLDEPEVVVEAIRELCKR